MKQFFLILLSVIIFSACGSNPQFDKQTYDQNKESLSDKEKTSPLDFLKVAGQDRKSLFGLGKETVVQGTISNSATICSYKDVRVKMLCYDNGKMVEEHEDVISDVIKPASTEAFKTRYRLTKGTDSIALSIMSAAVVAEAAGKRK